MWFELRLSSGNNYHFYPEKLSKNQAFLAGESGNVLPIRRYQCKKFVKTKGKGTDRCPATINAEWQLDISVLQRILIIDTDFDTITNIKNWKLYNDVFGPDEVPNEMDDQRIKIEQILSSSDSEDSKIM